YEREFGVVPRFRAGMHAGLVVVSECGGTKRQISYFGDAVNVAARLEEYCKTEGGDLVVSGDLMRRLELPPNLVAQNQGRARLRGRETPVDVYSVENERNMTLT